MNKKLAILITTRNRLSDLEITLKNLENLLADDRIEFIVCDDGSTDGTSLFLQELYPNIILTSNHHSKGLIYSRNKLMRKVSAPYAITLDDDAHFESSLSFMDVEDYFLANPNCAVLAFRIFWGKQMPKSSETYGSTQRVKSFVGCGHVWRMSAWKDIPEYPDWYIFYGEEEFASYHLFKKDWEVHYYPKIAVHHRVEVQKRRMNEDYYVRLRRSLRSSWYNYLLFLPLKVIPRKILYSIWMQVKIKVFKGDVRVLQYLLVSLWDVLTRMNQIKRNANRFTMEEYYEYMNLADTKIYWNPNE